MDKDQNTNSETQSNEEETLKAEQLNSDVQPDTSVNIEQSNIG